MSSLNDISLDHGAFSAARAQAHLTLLRMSCAVYDALGALNPLVALIFNRQYTPEKSESMLDYHLLVANYRYTLYLDLLVSVRNTPQETWPLPPWDVALLMHTHLLSPMKFRNDILSSPRYNTLAGLLNLPLMRLQDRLQHIDQPVIGERTRWNAEFPEAPYDLVHIRALPGFKSIPPGMYINSLYNAKRFSFTRPPPFSLNLIEAVKRQIVFARKITSIYPYDPVPDALLLDSQQRYAKFMNLIRLNATTNPVPALDIDLFWHTHQLSSSNYLPWCTHHIGRPINHDDTVGEGVLTTGLDETIAAWEGTYSEDYLNPSLGLTLSNASSHPREPSTADKTPPPGLTPAQLRLWDFDVSHQEKHEEMDYHVRQRRNQVAAYNDRIANLPPAPSLSSSTPGGGSFMKRLFRVAVADSGPHRELLRERSTALVGISRDLRSHAELKQAWGRQRWPLLVAARGWGDPTVTQGKFVRQPQGTAELNFPIYAATWYDDKQLGYYNYVSGGRGGGRAIEGGGLQIGGGMCAGLFNGGNCVAPIEHTSGAAACTGGSG